MKRIDAIIKPFKLGEVKQRLVADEHVDETVHAIAESARTGRIEDGRIFITRVDDVIRIRTGERGPAAV